MNTSLPLSNVIPVSVFISPAASPGLTFNQALIVGSSTAIPSATRLRQYTSTSAMLQDGFLTTAPEYLAATLYFGQTPTPTYLWVGRQDLTAISAVTVGNNAGSGYVVNDLVTVVQSGASGGQAKVSAVSNGIAATVSIHTGGTSYTVANNLATTGGTGTGLTIDITAVSSGVITTITLGNSSGSGYTVGDNVVVVQGGASGGTVTVTGVTNGIVTGVSLVVGAQGTSYTTANNLATTGGTGIGLTLSITASGETPLQAVTACRAANTEWYACTYVGSAADADHIAISGFIQSATPKSVYFLTSGNLAILNAATGNLFATLQGLKYNRTFMLYSTTQGGTYPNNAYAAAAVMGYAMGANTGAPGSYTDLMFKLISGIGPEPLTQTQVTLISGTVSRSSVGLNGNVFVAYNDGAYSWIQNATMADGSFFDQTLQLDMLANDILLSGINLLISVPALPITNGGVAQMRNVISGACARSQTRGFIAPSGTWSGVTVGPITAGTALPQGFYVYAPPVSSLSAGARSARQLPPITVLLQESQSGHSLTVSVYVQS